MPFTTAWGALIDIANLGAGDFVVLGAASSSVGLAAMQIAKHVGATPIAITRKGGKIDELKRAGFVHVLQTGAGDIEREILRLTDGQGIRIHRSHRRRRQAGACQGLHQRRLECRTFPGSDRPHLRLRGSRRSLSLPRGEQPVR
ncbi:zinc-binding dehydrogenase [Gluconobacter wancherniae]|nr:zinc-binding dehydrogenase [Gluconobacter wancherniae]